MPLSAQTFIKVSVSDKKNKKFTLPFITLTQYLFPLSTLKQTSTATIFKAKHNVLIHYIGDRSSRTLHCY